MEKNKKQNDTMPIFEEEWKDIFGYEGLYQVSTSGRIKSVARHTTKGGIMKTYLSKDTGYIGLSLSKNGKVRYATIHRIMAEAFIPNPENKPCINHKNSIRNDNRIENLEWCTHSENNIHAYKFGNNKITKNHLSQKTKKPVLQYDLSGNFIREFNSARTVEKLCNINHSNIRKCCIGKAKKANGFIWKYKIN